MRNIWAVCLKSNFKTDLRGELAEIQSCESLLSRLKGKLENDISS